MDAQGFHIRDTIVLDQELIRTLPVGKLRNAGINTLYFLGREVVFANENDDFVIKGFDVVIVADVLKRSGNGRLVVEGRDDAPNGVARPGPKVDILCRKLQGIHVRAKGGKGPKGPAQEEEGPTGVIDCVKDDHGQEVCGLIPEPDPTGPRGKKGGPGGAGGLISLVYVEDTVPGGFNLSSLESVGGDGGDGGDGGLGGPIIEVHSDNTHHPTGGRGDQGKPGPDGDDGLPVAPSALRVDDAGYASKLGQIADIPAAFWLEYRTKYAEYWFRAYNPAGAERSDYLKRALDEVDAILKLAPFNDTPKKYRARILQNQNVLGMARDQSIIPDFEAYRRFVVDYEPMIQGLFDRAENRIFASLAKEDVAAVLQTQVKHLEAMVNTDPTKLKGPMVIELEMANRNKQNAEAEKNAADQRMNQIKSRLFTLQIVVADQEAGGGGIQLPGGGLPLFAAVATAIIGSVAFPPGAGAAAVGMMLPIANDLAGGGGLVDEIQAILQGSSNLWKDLEPHLKNIASGSKGLGDYVKDYDDYIKGSNPDGPGSPMAPEQALKALEDKFKKDFGPQIEDATKVAVSFSKLARELGQAKGSTPEQKEFINLSRELVTLGQQYRQAQLRVQQAQDQVDIATSTLNIAIEDIGRLNELIGTLTEDAGVLKNAALQALERARKSRDALLGHYFRLARALEIYTLSYPPAKAGEGGGSSVLPKDSVYVRYDFGHVDPDTETAYRDGRLSGAKFILALDSTMPEIESLALANLQRAYLDRGGRLEPRSEPVLFTAEANKVEIDEFKKSRSLFFSVDLDDLPATDYEAKVTAVGVRLTGVSAPASTLNCLVKQCGRAVQKWMPSENADPPEATQWLVRGPDFDAVDSVVLTRSDPTTYEGTTKAIEPGDSQIELEVWGRGVAADWRITLDDRGAADLSNLSGIEVTIYYDAFLVLQDNQSTLKGVTHHSSAIRPGTTAHAEVTLVRPAPAQGTLVALASSHPDLVKVPSGVLVPEDAISASIPIEVAEKAANTTVRLTASAADYTVHTNLFFPPAPPKVKQVAGLGTQAGLNANVSGIAVNGKHVYATHGFWPPNDPHNSPSFGTLAVLGIDGSGQFKELAPRLGVGDQPGSVAVRTGNPATTIYVVNRGQKSYSLSIIDGNGPLKVIKEIELGQVPFDVAVNGSRIYVSGGSAGKVHVIDAATHVELPQIELPDPPQLKHGLFGIAIDSTAKRIYVARTYRSSPEAKINALTVIDAETHKVIGSFEIGPDPTQPMDVAVHPVTRRVYTANLGGASVPPSVAVIETVPNQRDAYRVIDTVRTQAGGKAVAVDAQRNHIYVAAGGGVQVVDAGNKEHPVIATIPTGKSAEAVAIDPVTGHVYVGDRMDGTLTRLTPLDAGVSVQWH